MSQTPEEKKSRKLKKLKKLKTRKKRKESALPPSQHPTAKPSKADIEKVLVTAANNKDKEAQYFLCLHYIKNNNIAEAVKYTKLIAEQGNLPEALRYSKLLAEQGNHPEARTCVELLAERAYCMFIDINREHKLSEKTARFDKKLMEWVALAAEYGHPQMQNYLGRCKYEEGDYKAAAEWFGLAAEKNFIPARVSLAHCFEQGYGIKKNAKYALWQYKLAAAAGDQYSQSKVNYYAAIDKIFQEKDSKTKESLILVAKGNRQAEAELIKIYQDLSEQLLQLRKTAPEQRIPIDLTANPSVALIKAAAKEGFAFGQLKLSRLYQDWISNLQAGGDSWSRRKLLQDCAPIPPLKTPPIIYGPDNSKSASSSSSSSISFSSSSASSTPSPFAGGNMTFPSPTAPLMISDPEVPKAESKQLLTQEKQDEKTLAGSSDVKSITKTLSLTTLNPLFFSHPTQQQPSKPSPSSTAQPMTETNKP